MSYTGSLFNFVNNSTSSFHTVLNAQSYLIKNGFEEVDFNEDWQLKADKKYFTKIYDSTLIAFIPHQNLREGMKIAVSHTDFPCLKIKPSADIIQNDYGKLNVEIYGGMILNTWFDRPLSIAGKVVLKGQNCYQPDVKFVDFKRPLMIIPNLAIHMDRSINSGKSISKHFESCCKIGWCTKVTKIFNNYVNVHKMGGKRLLWNRSVSQKMRVRIDEGAICDIIQSFQKRLYDHR